MRRSLPGWQPSNCLKEADGFRRQQEDLPQDDADGDVDDAHLLVGDDLSWGPSNEVPC